MKIADGIGADWMQFKVVCQENKALSKMLDFVNNAFGKMNLTIQEDEEECFPLQIVDAALDQMAQGIRLQIEEAGVRSHAEFQAKQKKIVSLREEATKVFFQDACSITCMMQGDKVMVKANMAELTQENEAIIEKYWSLIERETHGYKLHEKVEQRFSELFLDVIMNCAQEIMTKQEEFVAAKKRDLSSGDAYAAFAEQYVKSLWEELQAKHQQLQKERDQASNGEEQIILEYLLLQGKCKGPALLTMIIRQQLELIARQHEEYVKGMHPLIISQTDGLIEMAQEMLLNEKIILCRDIQYWKKKVNKVQEQGNEEDVKHYEEILRKCEKESSKNEEFGKEQLQKYEQQQLHSLEYTYEIFGDPAKIRQHIPAETVYEKALYSHLDCASSTVQTPQALMSLPAVMRMRAEDLSIEYFVKEMQREASRKIECFTQVCTAKATPHLIKE
ncbi:MAG: hypothetical protein JWO53_1354 [Chlamydiia bacterium]|nr:hypothetical protein [Chlamydiia bacterium]